MSGPSLPTLFSIPFANSGAKNTIPVGSSSPNASFTDGFPAVTMQPISSGGVPPAGQDFNGILYAITQHLVYLNAGKRYPYNADLSTAIGGYPKGAVLQGDDGKSEYSSLVDNNTTDPNTPANIGDYWAPYAGSAGCNGLYAVDTGTANAYVVALLPPVTVLAEGQEVVFKSTHVNDGACTLDIGAGDTTLLNNSGQPLEAGDLPVGGVFSAVYDATSNHFTLLTPVISQYNPGATPTNPPGAIIPYGGSSAPSGYLMCDGTSYAQASYAALYAIIGTTYGGSGGNFNVPDLRGKFPLGHSGSYALGATGGEATHTLTTNEMPAHTHGGVPTSFAGTMGAGGNNNVNDFDGTTNSTGGGAAHNNMPPYLTMNFCIALQGIYPPRP